MSISISGMIPPDWLQKVGIQIEWLSSIEHRLELVSMIWLIGSFLLIASLVYELNQREKLHKTEIERLMQSLEPREERKIRVKRWQDEIQVCESLQDFYNSSAFLEIEPLLNSDEKCEIEFVHKQGNVIEINDGFSTTVSTPLSRLLVCYRKALYRLEGLWGLI